MSEFDPNLVAVKNGRFFGLPYSSEEAAIVVLPLPWDVTTSYRDGTSHGPRAVLDASYQLDFFSPYRAEAWKTRIGTAPTPPAWLEKNIELRAKAKRVIESLEDGQQAPAKLLEEVNREGAAFHAATQAAAAQWLGAGKKVITLGGDHSVSLGPVRALADRQKFSVLHIDAHADLRVAYEGFEHSHASIMHHVKELPNVEKLVQVGLRDLSPDEHAEIVRNEKITAHFDWDLRRASAAGIAWNEQCKRIVEPLGTDVYLSVDIDGLDPRYCPGTGTPVPGGLEYWEFFALLEEVERSGRRFVGADLVEVAPSKDSEWDANVGARILFQLCQFLRG
ncbi:MAG: agmatinase family protein [Bdellovibrionota bacterium]